MRHIGKETSSMKPRTGEQDKSPQETGSGGHHLDLCFKVVTGGSDRDPLEFSLSSSSGPEMDKGHSAQGKIVTIKQIAVKWSEQLEPSLFVL